VIVLGVSLALLLAAGRCLARRTAAPDESRATAAVRLAVWAFAVLVAVEAALGAAGHLAPRATLLALAAVAAVLAFATRRLRPASETPRAPLTALDAAYLFALVAALFLRAWAGIHKTTSSTTRCLITCTSRRPGSRISGSRSYPRCSAIPRRPTRRRTSSSGSRS
jgi:hypothetical protein